MPLPLSGPGVKDESAAAALGARQGNLQRLPERIRRQRHRGAAGGPDHHGVRLEQRDCLAGIFRQQIAVGVDRGWLDPRGAQRRQPFLQQRTRHHRDRRPRGIAAALAEGKVQLLDVIGEVLFESVRHQLREARSGLHRHLRLGQQHVGARDQQAHAPSRGTRCGERQRPFLRRTDLCTAAVRDQPRGVLCRRARQTNE